MPKFLSPVRGIRPIAAVAAIAAVVSVGGLHARPVDAVTQPTVSAAQQPEKSATQRAAESGQRVEVEDERTETAKTYANPDGSMTLEQSASPVRKRRDGRWVELDPAMSKSGDKIRPAATAIDMEFSAGGDHELVSFTDSGERLSLSWPEPLPAPVIDGAKLVYPSVYPDVDLQINVTKETFAQVLVVRTRAAAASPELQQIEMGLEAPGMTVRRTSTGGVEAVGDSGEVVFNAPRPTMWDSSGARLAQPETADRTAEPLEGDTVAPMAVEVSSSSLVIQPDQALVKDPQTKYPLHIDPPFSGPRIARAMINEHYPATPTWNWGGDEGVGYQAFEPWSRKRLFFGFSTAKIANSQIISANFIAFETWSASCIPKVVEVWKTARPTENTTWNSGSGSTVWQQKLAQATVAYGRDGCEPGGFPVPFNVKSAVAAGAAANSASIYLGLRAADESDQNAWKRFRYDVVLTVNYNFAPVLHNRHIADPEAPCTTSMTGQPYIGAVRPKLTVAVTDSDSNSLQAQFEIRRAIDEGPSFTGTTASKAGGVSSEFDFTPTTDLWNKTTYVWRVRATDGSAYTPWSTDCYFFLDTTRPPSPTITAVTAGPYTVGSPITIRFGTSTSDVVAFKYTVNVDAVPSASIPRSPGTATFTSTHFGPQVVRAWAVDQAGNTSFAPTSLKLVAADRPATGHWRMDEGAGTSTADVSANSRTMYLGPTVSWGDGDQGVWALPVPDKALFIPGLQTEGGTTATTATDLVDSTENFSVAVRVRPDIKSNEQVVVSEDRPGNSGFTLGSTSMTWTGKNTPNDPTDDDPTNRKIVWAFTLATSSGVFRLETIPLSYNAAAVAETERWVDLVATYNKGTKTATLYVNGSWRAAQVTGTVVDGAGPLRTGLGIEGGAVTNFYRGYLDDLIIYDGSVSDALIRSYTDGDS
ncbi:LamG-like jellyroll fold domain-containing protein [Kribbella italica]|uniref:LamG-like jellyroll fold domain-containing protein n=1 Tax=Kribbella italica TaxID=1540520 RepID=A0A7W9JA34_9ACTN|nr:LamG-like jellyroll fold domain-containing protein [Kribbella italica]MBB5838387.1 hypothetical protein [Kribbella italica]